MLQRGLDVAALDQWSIEDDGKIAAPDQHKYRTLRDALRAYQFAVSGAIGREDMYFLAILRRRLAERELPLQDGPIAVVSLGRIVPEPLFHTSKKLFPVRLAVAFWAVCECAPDLVWPRCRLATRRS
jgi:hypothetical protein